jgi:hypothetical protein
MKKPKGAEGRIIILDYLRSRRRYWQLKEQAEDGRKWKQQYIKRT